MDLTPKPDDTWIGSCENCSSDGAIRWKGWCLACGKSAMLCGDCVKDPARTALGRLCPECFGAGDKPDTSGPGGQVKRQMKGRGRTSS